MATPYFNRPLPADDQQPLCSEGLKVGLSVITAVLGTLCWIRATTSLYSYRCVRHECRKGLLWFLFSVLEGAAVTSLFAAVAVLTPPGSTCFLYNAQREPTVTTFTTYNILTAATLLSFSVPRMLSWLMCLAELMGIKARVIGSTFPVLFGQVRREPDLLSCARVGGSDGFKGPACSQPAPTPGKRGFFRFLFDNDQLEWFVWQLLPCGSVLLYQISTAYYSSYSPMDFAAGACTTADKSWLIALVAIISAVGFFVTLGSFEFDCYTGTTSEASLFRSRGVGYRIMALVFSICTSGSFVAVALLTPPAGPCLFPARYQDDFLQVLGTSLLPSLALAAIVLGVIRYAVNKKATRYDVTANVPSRREPSAPPMETYSGHTQSTPFNQPGQFMATPV